MDYQTGGRGCFNCELFYGLAMTARRERFCGLAVNAPLALALPRLISFLFLMPSTTVLHHEFLKGSSSRPLSHAVDIFSHHTLISTKLNILAIVF